MQELNLLIFLFFYFRVNGIKTIFLAALTLTSLKVKVFSTSHPSALHNIPHSCSAQLEMFHQNTLTQVAHIISLMSHGDSVTKPDFYYY